MEEDKNSQESLSLELPKVNNRVIDEEIKEERDEKKVILALTFIGIFLSIIVGHKFFLFLKKQVIGNSRSTQISIEEEIQAEDSESDSNVINKIAYITSGDIWVYDLDESKNIQVTSDGGIDSKYTSIAWKDTEQLTFSKCQTVSCNIQTHHISEGKTDEVFKTDNEEIISLRWAHKGDKLAYLFRRENFIYLTVKYGDIFRNLGKFSYMGEKAIDYNDALYIRFSPNDEKIMLVNTFSKPEDPSLVVLTTNGEEILVLKEEGGALPSFGFFTSDDTIYYKRGEFLYVRSLSENRETQLTDRIIGAFDFQPSPDKASITYWTFDWPSGVSTIWIYEIGSDSIKRLRDQESYPVWVNSSTLVTLHLPNCPTCPRFNLKFGGFSRTDLKTKVVSPLIDLENLEMFTAEKS
ncbi:hypothetical protein JW766_05870 [Candidatus Dojkabacteria bacterium]|nr:hypothetical protein [Candidatus Dojkabacteria bacterium]